MGAGCCTRVLPVSTFKARGPPAGPREERASASTDSHAAPLLFPTVVYESGAASKPSALLRRPQRCVSMRTFNRRRQLERRRNWRRRWRVCSERGSARCCSPHKRSDPLEQLLPLLTHHDGLALLHFVSRSLQPAHNLACKHIPTFEACEKVTGVSAGAQASQALASGARLPLQRLRSLL